MRQHHQIPATTTPTPTTNRSHSGPLSTRIPSKPNTITPPVCPTKKPRSAAPNTFTMLLLGNFLYVIVLCLNAIAVLSEDRFLARINLSTSTYDPAFGAGDSQSVKAKIINGIASVRLVTRIPLIAVNTLIIIYELILG
ncbi:yos1-like protein [Apiospora arundinis]